MNFKKLAFAAAITVSAATLQANAQKAYKEGAITYNIESPMGSMESKILFKGDSSVMQMQQGPATIKVISAGDNDYRAILVDVPVASKKFAAVATPAELEDEQAKLPELTFTPTTETKQIAGFNCKKVTAKDTKSNDTFDVWVTNDISLSIPNSLYAKAGGVPVDFYLFNMGKTHVTLKSVTDEKVPAGSFGIAADYQRISLSDLQAMGGRRK